MIIFLIGCISMHQVGKLTDYSSTSTKEKQAHRAVTIAQKDTIGQKSTEKTAAMQAVGRLRVADSTTINGTINVLNKASKSSPLYYQAIWTLGELGRELPWNEESQQIHRTLLQHLTDSTSNTAAHYLLEAIGKVYCQHSHTLEEDVQTTKVLNAYEAKHREVPNILFVILDRIHSLPVLIALLNEELDNASTTEAYIAVLELMSFLHENQAQLINNHSHYQEQIQEAFDSTTAMLDLDSKALTLMTVWMLSEVAADPVLSSYVVDSIIELTGSSFSTRHIVIYALSKMTNAEKSRNYFRTQYFQHERNENNLEMLRHSQHRDLDLIQQLYGIQLENSNAP